MLRITTVLLAFAILAPGAARADQDCPPSVAAAAKRQASGQRAVQAGRIPRAMTTFRKALALADCPETFASRRALAEFYMSEERYTEAQEILQTPYTPLDEDAAWVQGAEAKILAGRVMHPQLALPEPAPPIDGPEPDGRKAWIATGLVAAILAGSLGIAAGAAGGDRLPDTPDPRGGVVEGPLRCPECPAAFGVTAIGAGVFGSIVLGVNLFQ